MLVSGYLLLQPGAQEAGVEAIKRARAPWIGVEAASWPLVESVESAGFDDLAAGATIVLANEREAEALTGLPAVDAARSRGAVPGRLREARCGGAALVIDGDLLEHAADPVVEADPTGAGDAFDGVLLGSLARGIEPRKRCDGPAPPGRRWPRARPCGRRSRDERRAPDRRRGRVGPGRSRAVGAWRRA